MGSGVQISKFSSSKIADFMGAFTPKELRRIAQGCRVSRLPWVRGSIDSCTLKGFRHWGFIHVSLPLELYKIEYDERSVWD